MTSMSVSPVTEFRRQSLGRCVLPLSVSFLASLNRHRSMTNSARIITADRLLPSPSGLRYERAHVTSTFIIFHILADFFHYCMDACACICSCSRDNDAKSSDGPGARTSDDSRMHHHSVPSDRQLLGEGRPQADQLRQVPRRRLRRWRS